MKKFLRGFTGKGKEAAGSPATPDREPYYGGQEWAAQPPPAFIPQHTVVSNGSMRRPRRPKETIDLNYADYAPFAPQPPPPQQAPAAQDPLEVQQQQQQQLAEDEELARQLAMQEMQQAQAPMLAPPPLPPVQPAPPPPPPPPQQDEQQREAAYQAALDAALEESILQADYDNILRDIKLWILDLSCALADVEEAQDVARAKRAELDARMGAADPEDEEGWRQIMWLSECHAETEAKLQELGWRLKPIGDTVNALRDLDAYIRADKPPVQAARDALDRIIAKLLEALNVMGFAFHHPTAPFGRESGEGSSKDHEARSRDPLRELVHSLIEETKRVAPPPLPVSAKKEPPPPPLPQLQQVEEEPAAQEWEALPEQEAPVQPEPRSASPPSPPPPPVELPAPDIPRTPETSSPPAPTAPHAPTPTPAPPQTVSPRAAPGSDGWSSDGGSSHVGSRVRSTRTFLTSTRRTPLPRERDFRQRSSGIKPQPGDAIKRLPRVVALYHELGKGVVADTVGWQSTKPQAGKKSPGSSPAVKFAPRSHPTRLPPSVSKPSKQGPAAASAGATGPGGGGKDTDKGQGASSSLSASSQAQLAAELAAFKAESLVDAADFVDELRERGAGEAGGAGWPKDKWATVCEAAEVHDALCKMAADLSQWSVDAQAGTIAESHRLASFMDDVSREAARVTYAHDSLRVRMAKHGVPWDPSLLVDMRWAAQVAACQLMTHALEEAEQQGKSKRWQAAAVLQPLGHAAMGAFKVHQFCGGLNMAATALFDRLAERTIHYARMIDHQFIRDTKWA